MRTGIDIIREFVRIANETQRLSAPADIQREQAKLGQLFLEAEAYLEVVDGKREGVLQ